MRKKIYLFVLCTFLVIFSLLQGQVVIRDSVVVNGPTENVAGTSFYWGTEEIESFLLCTTDKGDTSIIGIEFGDSVRINQNDSNQILAKNIGAKIQASVMTVSLTLTLQYKDVQCNTGIYYRDYVIPGVVVRAPVNTIAQILNAMDQGSGYPYQIRWQSLGDGSILIYLVQIILRDPSEFEMVAECFDEETQTYYRMWLIGKLNSIAPNINVNEDGTISIGWPGVVETQFKMNYPYKYELSIKDTIRHGETTPVGIRAVDNAGNDYYGAFENILTFTIEGSTASWGSLVDLYGSPLANPVSYLNAVVGFVKYNANGAVPPNPSLVIIKVEDQYGVKGDCNAVVTKSDIIKLEIIIPNIDGGIEYITNAPQMPTITCQARLSGCDENVNIIANWESLVSYAYPPGTDEATYTENNTFNTDFISVWALDYNPSTNIIGGQATISARTTINDVDYSATRIVHIRGNNPNVVDVENGLDNGQITMLETETNGHDQFDTEDYDNPSVGLPLRSDADNHGWGMCQIDDRWHTIATGILWDWTANRDYGINYYNDLRNTAAAHLAATGNLNAPAPGQTQQSMIDSEGYARYNDGPDGQFWEWIEPSETNPIGHWIQHATHLNNGQRVDAPDLETHVENYLGHYND